MTSCGDVDLCQHWLMVCLLPAQSHQGNQCGLIINDISWYLGVGDPSRTVREFYHGIVYGHINTKYGPVWFDGVPFRMTSLARTREALGYKPWLFHIIVHENVVIDFGGQNIQFSMPVSCMCPSSFMEIFAIVSTILCNDPQSITLIRPWPYVQKS